jgi:hypothetical protein
MRANPQPKQSLEEEPWPRSKHDPEELICGEAQFERPSNLYAATLYFSGIDPRII